jgi:hypothetical protein
MLRLGRQAMPRDVLVPGGLILNFSPCQADLQGRHRGPLEQAHGMRVPCKWPIHVHRSTLIHQPTTVLLLNYSSLRRAVASIKNYQID